MAKAKRGRPALQITDKQRAQVLAYANVGVPHKDIATLVGMGQDSLLKYCGEELARGKATANAKVAPRLFAIATGRGKGSLSAAIFWAKTQMGWHETSVVQNQNLGKDGEPVDPPGTVIRFPNGGPGQ